MGPHYRTEIVVRVQQLLDDVTNMGPVTIWKMIKTILMDASIIYEVEASPTTVLCHPSNRGKLGLNPFTAHRTGSRILSIGCDRDELEKSVCIEINPDPAIKDEQLQFNQALIDRSQGLFSAMNGSERFLSLGGGHAVAFCRAVLAGCRTTEASIMDSDGMLNSGTLTAKDRVFGECLKGWKQTVLPWQAEVVWPKLPSLIQRALNSSQNVAEHQTELETMCTIA
jgi:hypothetical protein